MRGRCGGGAKCRWYKGAKVQVSRVKVQRRCRAGATTTR